MPRCGAKLRESIPLLGGASARGAGVGGELLGKPTPSASGSHPSDGDFLRTGTSLAM